MSLDQSTVAVKPDPRSQIENLKPLQLKGKSHFNRCLAITTR